MWDELCSGPQDPATRRGPRVAPQPDRDASVVTVTVGRGLRKARPPERLASLSHHWRCGTSQAVVGTRRVRNVPTGPGE